MFHQRITLPESHPDYPCVWQSECGRWRVIRCLMTFSISFSSTAVPNGAVRVTIESGGVLNEGTAVEIYTHRLKQFAVIVIHKSIR